MRFTNSAVIENAQKKYKRIGFFLTKASILSGEGHVYLEYYLKPSGDYFVVVRSFKGPGVDYYPTTEITHLVQIGDEDMNKSILIQDFTWLYDKMCDNTKIWIMGRKKNPGP